jgi:uncharacterized protein YqgC (DUF456 family)
MRLYVQKNSQKIYLDTIAPTRRALAFKIGTRFIIQNVQYNVTQVKAEAGSSSAASGTVIGGLIGLLAGPIGMIIGGGIGTAIGTGADKEENQKVRTFNESQVWI